MKSNLNTQESNYLQQFLKVESLTKYFIYETERVKKLKKIEPELWVQILKKQNMCCYYCQINLSIFQKLILNNLLGLRKRGKEGYSGMFFEIDHKNANNKDNRSSNIVASCYYCNNDKSNTIHYELYKNYFGAARRLAILALVKEKHISVSKVEYLHIIEKYNE